ncbi:MAG: hypothetical protein AAGD11_17110 [Planctomycetota bacterium]
MSESQLSQRSLESPIGTLVGWILLALVIALLLALVPNASAQVPVDTGPAQGRQVDLETQLLVGLKAFTAADRLFINRVVNEVRLGRLPRRLVDTTFLWARDRAVRRSYSRQFRPMVYFQPGLTLRARAIGVTL